MSVTDRSRLGVTTGRAGNQTHEAWLLPDHPMHRPRHGRRQPTALSGPQPEPRLAGAGIAPHPPIVPFPAVIEGRDGWLYLGADVSGACAPCRSLSDTMMSLRRLRAAVKASGRQFILVVPPDKTTMVPEHLPVDYLGKDCSAQTRGQFWRRVLPKPERSICGRRSST